MTNIINALNICQISLFVFIILLALIYSIPILLIRRFHNVNNVYTVNLCIATICACIYWLFYYTVLEFYPQILFSNTACIILNYFEMLCIFQVSLAIVEVSVHRLCSIVYHTKLLFKKKRWALICIVSQWTTGIIFSLPRISFIDLICNTQYWRRVYTFIMIVIIPILICLINNIIIFNYVRSSTNRTQPISTVTSNSQHQHINRRDLHLLRHMIVMFCIFIGGWSPIFIYSIVIYDVKFTSMIVSFLILLAELSLCFDIINLFLYNHELRRYFREKIFKCC